MLFSFCLFKLFLLGRVLRATSPDPKPSRILFLLFQPCPHTRNNRNTISSEKQCFFIIFGVPHSFPYLYLSLYLSIYLEKYIYIYTYVSLSLCLSSLSLSLAPRTRHLCISKQSSFLQTPWARNTFLSLTGWPTSGCFRMLH